MKTEKRLARSYKATDKVYKRAMRMAKKEKTTLANVIEDFVERYGQPRKSPTPQSVPKEIIAQLNQL